MFVGSAARPKPTRHWSRGARSAVWPHLVADNIAIVLTNQVGWSEDRKTDPDVLETSSGVSGSEPLCALLLEGVDQRKLPLTPAAHLLGLRRSGSAISRERHGRA
jgi:dihydroorotase-like cyclic amidohydrolase